MLIFGKGYPESESVVFIFVWFNFVLNNAIGSYFDQLMNMFLSSI